MYRVVVAVLLLTLWTPAEAKPAKGPIRHFALRELKIDGPVSDADKKLIRERVHSNYDLFAGYRGQSIDDSQVERVLEERPYLRDCTDRSCSLELGDRVGADRLIFIRIERQGSDPSAPRGEWQARLMSFAVDAAQNVDTQIVPCHGCTVEEVVSDLAHTMEPFFKNDPFVQLCKLKVSSRPPDADVLVDTAKVGKTPFAHTLIAGRHAIVVERPGFARGEAEIDCPAGGGQDVVFTLSTERSVATTKTTNGSPAVESTTTPNRRPVLRALGGVSLGLAVGSLVALGVSAGLYNRSSECDSAGRCAQHYNMTTGLALGAVGVVAFGVTGAILLAKANKSAPSRPTAWIAPALGSVRVGGTF